MCPIWIIFIVFCIILYTLKYSPIKIFNIPLGIVLAVIAVSYYVYTSNNTENFTTEKIKVFNFNTTWCGWSKKFQPEWDTFAKTINSSPDADKYEVKDIKCDDINDPEIKKLTTKYKVPGYPYVIIEKDGVPQSYEGPRKSADLLKFVQAL